MGNYRHPRNSSSFVGCIARLQCVSRRVYSFARRPITAYTLYNTGYTLCTESFLSQLYTDTSANEETTESLISLHWLLAMTRAEKACQSGSLSSKHTAPPPRYICTHMLNVELCIKSERRCDVSRLAKYEYAMRAVTPSQSIALYQLGRRLG